MKLETIKMKNTIPIYQVPAYTDRETLRKLRLKSPYGYVLLRVGDAPLELPEGSAARMLQVAEDSGAVLLYSDYYLLKNGQRLPLLSDTSLSRNCSNFPPPVFGILAISAWV